MSDIKVGDRVEWQQKDRGRTGAYYTMQGVVVRILDDLITVETGGKGGRRAHKSLRELTKVKPSEGA